METREGILDLLKQQGDEALLRSRRAVIIQPGAIGDCVLTLPLAQFIRNHLKLGAIDMIGHADYISYFPGRTCIDTIRALDSVDMHRLFCTTGSFNLTERDTLVDTFAGYSWIVSFLGETESDFEQNLIFTANCSQSAEVIIVPLKPALTELDHVAGRYIRCLCGNCGLQVPDELNLSQAEPLVKPTKSDKQIGERIIQKAGINTDAPVIVLCPGSGSANKCWNLDNFLAIAEHLKSTGAEPLILLGPAEIERFLPRRLIDISYTATFLAELSLTEVLQVLSCADAFVGNDSGITHLAAATGLNTIAMFGPTNPATYRPLGRSVCVIEDKNANFVLQPSQDLQQRVLRQLDEFCA